MKKDNTSIRIQIYSRREAYSFSFPLVFNPVFSNQIVSIGLLHKFSIKRDRKKINFSLSNNSKKKKNYDPTMVKLFFYRFQEHHNRKKCTFIYDYIRLLPYRIFSLPRSSYRRTRNIFSSRTLLAPPSTFAEACIMVTPSWRCCNIVILLFYARRRWTCLPQLWNTFPPGFLAWTLLKCIHDGAISRAFYSRWIFLWRPLPAPIFPCINAYNYPVYANWF